MPPIFVYWSVPLIRSVCKVPGETLSIFFTSSDLSHFLTGVLSVLRRDLSSVNNSDLKVCKSSVVRICTDIVVNFMEQKK